MKIKNLTQIFMLGVILGAVYFLSIYALITSIAGGDWIYISFFLGTTILLSGIIDHYYLQLKRCRNVQTDKA